MRNKKANKTRQKTENRLLAFVQDEGQGLTGATGNVIQAQDPALLNSSTPGKLHFLPPKEDKL